MTPSIATQSHAAGPSRTIWFLLALTPLWLLIVTALGSATFTDAISNPPAVQSLPLGVVLESLAILWMLAGLAVVWRARSTVSESLALLLFTIPATVVVVLTPAAIEIIRSVG